MGTYTMPLVSIGLPTYDRPEALRRALTELLNQTYKNIEVIVADNASPGEAVDLVIRSFSVTDTRIKHFRHAENIGMARNWQFVLDQAVGKYYVQASDDDCRDPDFVSELAALLEAEPAATIAFCEYQAIDPQGTPLKGYGPYYKALKALTTGCPWLRQVRFFLQDERAGKSNLVYGMVRASGLKGFKWSDLQARYGEQGADVLFAFWQLCGGPLVVSPRKLFSSCVGNIKSYKVHVPKSVFARFADHMAIMGKYSVKYSMIAGSPMRWVLLVLWPIKMFLVAYAMVGNKVSLVFRRLTA